MLLRTSILIIAIIGLNNCQAGPTAAKSDNLQCAVCQFLGASTAVRTGGNRAQSVAHCLKFDGCEKQLTDCEIVRTVHSEIQKTPEKFESALEMVSDAANKCSITPEALVISESASSPQCMLCFLVYDVLKYINYNILENPMLGTFKNALEEACPFLNDALCQALFQPDTFGAIIRGFQDSLGGFYNLIAVQGFGCVPYTDLFGKCPGH